MKEVGFFRIANQKTRTGHVDVHEQSMRTAGDAVHISSVFSTIIINA